MDGSHDINPFEEHHYTITELAQMWNFSKEFVRQIVRKEPGVTEWVRQQPGRRRYSVIRVPQSVAERLYRRAVTRASGDTPVVQPRRGRRIGRRLNTQPPDGQEHGTQPGGSVHGR